MENVELRSPAAGPGFQTALVGAGILLLSAAVVTGRGVAPAAAVLALVALAAVAYRSSVRWDVLVSLILVVVLVIPIKRYEFAVALPFDLEPYRVAVAILLGIWILALLVDSRVRLRRSALDGPLMLFGLAVIASVALNPGSITRFNLVRSFTGESFESLVRDVTRLPLVDLSGSVTKKLLFLVSFYLLFYVIVAVIRTPGAIHTVLGTLVLGTTGVAAFAIIERRTSYNVFDHLQGWIPLLQFEGGLEESGISRAGRLRVYASAQHPIALAALFAMVLSPSVYLAVHTRRHLWTATSVVLGLGTLATVSRTGITMLAAVLLVFVVLRRELVRKLVPFVLPALVVIHLAVPGSIGGLRQSFFPSEGLVADQTVFGGRLSADRIGPQLLIIKEQPAFGQGYGTRITSGPNTNSRVLDDEWLATGVETGLVGVAAWVWLFVRFLRRAGGDAKRDSSGRGFLLTALAGSAAAFGVGMLTFDAFSFIQATLVFFVLLAIGASTLAYRGSWPERAPAKGRLPAPAPSS